MTREHSLAPLLLIVVSVAGLVFGEDAARGEIQAQLVERYRTIFKWDMPEIDEALSNRLVLSAIREALAGVKKALPDTSPP